VIVTGSTLDTLRARPAVVLNRGMSVTPGRVAALTELLDSFGFEVEQREDGPLDDLSPAHVVWIWGCANWFPRAMRSLVERPVGLRPATVLWHIEPFPLPRASGRPWPRPTARELAKIVLRDRRASDVYSNYFTLRRLISRGIPDVLAVTSGERAAFLAGRGIDAFVAPFGRRATDGRDLGLARDIDVLLLGVMNVPHRRHVVRHLRKSGVPVMTAGDYGNPSLWGESRTALVNRVKIMLSIGRFPGTLVGVRFQIAMACGALVVSEPPYDPTPYVPGEHFVQASVEDMPSVIRHYLADDRERLRITQCAHRFVTTELTMERSFSSLLDVVASRL
jgi:Glycosyl transferases group 1